MAMRRQLRSTPVHLPWALRANVPKYLERRRDENAAPGVPLVGDTRCKTSPKLRTESQEVPKTDRLADFAHHVKVKVHVMEGGERGAENFARRKKMAEICARIPLAGWAGAIFIDGTWIFCIARIFDEELALPGEKATVTRAARWQNAVHHVH